MDHFHMLHHGYLHRGYLEISDAILPILKIIYIVTSASLYFFIPILTENTDDVYFIIYKFGEGLMHQTILTKCIIDNTEYSVMNFCKLNGYLP